MAAAAVLGAGFDRNIMQQHHQQQQQQPQCCFNPQPSGSI
jgi:hypothetical protein